MQKNIEVPRTKILLTGGHAGATSFAVIEELISRHKDWKLYFVGGKSSFEGKKIKTLAEANLKGSEVEYFFLHTGRMQRRFSFWTIPSLLKIPIGVLQSIYLLMKINPDLVLSFGGYAGLPVCFASWILRKPLLIHEQTSAAGRANIHASYFAEKILLARASSLPYFDKKKCQIIGNPISKGVRSLKPKLVLRNPPILLIHGGASGSVAINTLVDKLLEKLLNKYIVIHQTGELNYPYFIQRKNALSDNLKKKYFVYGVVKSSEWHKILNKADILISRAGGNIVSEILCAKIPSLLIPLPFAYLDEQVRNADFAKKFGIALVLNQGGLTPDLLYQNVEGIHKNWLKITESVKEKKSPDLLAAKKLVDFMESQIY